MTGQTLVNLVNNAGFDPVVYGDLDAAARALLRRHDAAPLLRLAALSIGFDDTNYTAAGVQRRPVLRRGLHRLRAAVQPDRTACGPGPRSTAPRCASEPQHVFAPFTISPVDPAGPVHRGLQRLPGLADADAPGPADHPHAAAGAGQLPVLILSGTFDSLTPWLDGATLVARQMGPSARVVRVANLTHVTLQDANDACPASIYQRFVRNPGGPGQREHLMRAAVSRRFTPSAATRCAWPAPCPPPPRQANTAGPPGAAGRLRGAGQRRGRDQPLAAAGRRHATSACAAAGSRSPATRVLRITLSNVRWVTDATIDGTARWNQPADLVTARLTVHPAGAAPVRLTARWRPFGQQDQLAVITGSQGGKRLAATCPAP